MINDVNDRLTGRFVPKDAYAVTHERISAGKRKNENPLDTHPIGCDTIDEVEHRTRLLPPFECDYSAPFDPFQLKDSRAQMKGTSTVTQRSQVRVLPGSLGPVAQSVEH